VTVTGDNSYGIETAGGNNKLIVQDNALLNIIATSTSTNATTGIYIKDNTSYNPPVAPYLISVNNNGKINITVNNKNNSSTSYGWGLSTGVTNTPTGDKQGAMGSLLLADNAQMNINTTGNRTGGINNQNTWNFYMTVSDNSTLNITTNGDNSVGFRSNNIYNDYNRQHPSQVQVIDSGTLNITTKGNNSTGLLTLNNVFTAKDNATVKISTEGASSNAVVADTGTKNAGVNNFLGASTTTITTTGDYSSAMVSSNGGTNNVLGTAALTIATHGIKACGILANGGNVTLGGNSVTTINSSSTTSNDGDAFSLENNGTITLTDNAVANVTTTEDYADGISNQGGTFHSTSGTQLNINVQNSGSDGIFIFSPDAKVELEGDVNITNTGDGHGVYIQNAGTAALNGNTIINMGDTAAEAIRTEGSDQAASVVVNANGGKLVQISGDINDQGNYANTIDLNLDTSESFLRGQILGLASDTATTTLNLSNGAKWQVTKEDQSNSYLENLNLSSDAVVDMNYTGPGNYGNVTVQNLAGGGGAFKLTTDLLKTKEGTKNVLTDSDKINITGTSSGNYEIQIQDESLTTLKEASGYLLLVHDTSANKEATFTGQELESGGIFKYQANLSDQAPDPAYHYTNVPTDGRNWYLISISRKEELSDNAMTNIGLSESRYEAYHNERSEQDSLLKRLGELRFSGEDEGVWARVKRNKFSADGYSLKGGTSTTYQVGWDKKFGTEDAGNHHVGLALSRTESNSTLHTSANLSGATNSLTVYDTWHGPKGHYWDLVGKVGRMSADFILNGKYPEKGTSAAYYFNASMEYGRKISNPKTGWYVEPQAQLGLGRVAEDNYTSTQGTRVKFDSINSLVFRTGVNIGKAFGPKGLPGKVYGKLYYNREFKGDVSWHLADRNGDTLDDHEDYGGSWWTVGLGTAARITRATYLYFDVEKDFSGTLRNDWQFNGGVRWSW
jgi:outer membrane autotransporter protein